MSRREVDELMNLEWVLDVSQDPDGGYMLTVQGLEDFVVYGNSEEEVLEDFEDAMRSHLEGYLATNKALPSPVYHYRLDPPAMKGFNWLYNVGFSVAQGVSHRVRRTYT